jgi:hypothetical protein
MFKMKEYPPDILPLYSQGYSLARFFIEQGGKGKFVEYVGEGMRSNNWTATTRKFYGFNSLSDLQLTWVEWVRAGSPNLPAGRVPDTLLVSAQAPAGGPAAQPVSGPRTAPVRNAVASNIMPGTQMASIARPPLNRTPDGPPSSWQTVGSQNGRVFAQADQITTPPEVASSARPAVVPPIAGKTQSPDYSSVSRPVSEGWYAKQRDQAQASTASALPSQPVGVYAERSAAAANESTNEPRLSSYNEVPPLPPSSTAIQARPATAPGVGDPLSANCSANPSRVLLEWTRSATEPGPESAANRADLTGVAANTQTALMR